MSSQRCPPEFKDEALRQQVLEQGHTVAERSVATAGSVSSQSLQMG